MSNTAVGNTAVNSRPSTARRIAIATGVAVVIAGNLRRARRR